MDPAFRTQEDPNLTLDALRGAWRGTKSYMPELLRERMQAAEDWGEQTGATAAAKGGLEALAPAEPWEVAAMGFGPAAKLGKHALQAVGGATALTAGMGEAEAGKRKLLGKGAKAADKAGKLVEPVFKPPEPTGGLDDLLKPQGFVESEEFVKKPKAKAPDVNPALKGFGEAKQGREAATAARLKAQTQAAEASAGAEPVRQKGKGGRAKVEPDIFRQQYAAAPTPEEGYESVLRSAQRGEHLKPAPAGGWVGMPRTVTTVPERTAMRKALDQQFDRGWEALQYADPERTGTWYDRAKAAQAQIHEPFQLNRGLEGTAAYSAGVAPESELTFTLKHGNSRAIGEPVMAYRGAPMRMLDEAVAQDVPADLAHKVGEYRGKNDPRVEELSPFGVNDFRMAQAFGYTDPAGNPWKAGVSDTMHPVMDAETVLGVQRARERTGRGNITGSTYQEIPWVLNKAEDIYGRGKQGRFAGGEEGMVAALREANNTIEDYLPKHAASATYEYVPGADVGHVPQVLGMDMPGKQQYGQQGAWATPSPEDPTMSGMPASVGAGNRDALYRAALLRQQPTTEAVGQYVNRAGDVENNPVNIARPLMDFQTVGEGGATQAGTVNPNTLKGVEAIEGMRGTIDAQEAAAMNLPVTTSGRTGQTSTLLGRDQPPTPDELRAITARIQVLREADEARMAKAQNKVQGPLPEGQQAQFDPYAGVTPTNRGALVLNKGGRPMTAKQRALLEQDMPGATAQSADFEGVYTPGVTPASEAGQGIATARMLQRFADAPPEVARNVGESDEIRSLIRQKMERDEAMGGARPDIQKMRGFMSEADWPKAVALMRQGMKPAAALAALGYSLQGMAAEEPAR